jgi:hypothetical protein
MTNDAAPEELLGPYGLVFVLNLFSLVSILLKKSKYLPV